MKRKVITSVDQRDGRHHTESGKGQMGTAIYVEYLGGGSHISHNVAYPDGYVRSCIDNAKSLVGKSTQPISVYRLESNSMQVKDVADTEGRLKLVTNVSVPYTSAVHLWGMVAI